MAKFLLRQAAEPSDRKSHEKVPDMTEKRKKRTLDKEIGNFDILIGATALHYGLTVVTDNLKHFEQMPGVKVENWIARE